jgi:hypothetical protein
MLLKVPNNDLEDNDIVIEMAPEVAVVPKKGGRGSVLRGSFSDQMKRIFIPHEEDKAKTCKCRFLAG